MFTWRSVYTAIAFVVFIAFADAPAVRAGTTCTSAASQETRVWRDECNSGCNSRVCKGNCFVRSKAILAMNKSSCLAKKAWCAAQPGCVEVKWKDYWISR